MIDVVLLPISARQLLDCDEFVYAITFAHEKISKEGIKCIRIILDKDDSSHRLPILMSFTRITDEERRRSKDIPKDAYMHLFINEEELAKVKTYDAVEAAKNMTDFLRLINKFSKDIHRYL